MRSLTHWNRLNSRISATPRTFLSPPSKKPKKFICQQNLKSGGERSNAAARTAVCRRATVTRAPRSRARLIPVTTRRDSWRSHVHRTYTAQRVQPFKPKARNASLSLGDKKGGILFCEREYPLCLAAALSAALSMQRSALHPPAHPSDGGGKSKCTLRSAPSSCYDETIIEKVRTLPMILSEAIQSLIGPAGEACRLRPRHGSALL